MRGMKLPCIAVLLAASPSTAAQNAWSADTQLSAPIVRYDGENFGVIIGCDNQFTFKITVISDPGTLGTLGTQDQQFVLLVDGKEIARKAAWLTDPVSGLVAFETFLPSGKMSELTAGKHDASFMIGDGMAGGGIGFDVSMAGLAEHSAPLVKYCSALE